MMIMNNLHTADICCYINKYIWWK